jgi:hypothetical protein
MKIMLGIIIGLLLLIIISMGYAVDRDSKIMTKLEWIEMWILNNSEMTEESTRRISDEALQYYINIDQKVGYLKDIFEFTPDPCKLKTKEQPKGK